MDEFSRGILDSKVVYSNHGFISYKFNKDIYFKIAKLSFELFENEEFQYCFEPYYDVLDAFKDLDIPGIDLSLRLPNYYRANITPSFVSERITPRNRVNLYEDLKDQGFDYYQPFLLLLNSKRTYGGDQLSLKSGQFYDHKLASMEESSDIYKTISAVLMKLAARITFKIGNIEVNDENRSILIENYLYLFSKISKYYDSKSKGSKGRKKKEISFITLEEIYSQYKHGIISINDAIKRSGLGSRRTFYRRIKELTNQPKKNDSK